MKLREPVCVSRCDERGKKSSAKLTALLLALLVLVSACGAIESSETPTVSAASYYQEVPGVTEQEIQAIEQLKADRESFTFGSHYGTELFVLPDGSYEGSIYRLCELLTELFDFPFDAVLYEDWDELKGGHDAAVIDFIGTLTPTQERLEIYQMSSPIAERSLRLFTNRHGRSISKEADIENLTIAFLSGTITAQYIKKAYSFDFQAVEVDSYEEAAERLVAGDIDGFVEEDVADTFFLDYPDIESKKFFSMVYSPVSVSSANADFAPIISVLDKYLLSGGVNTLLDMQEFANHEYAKYKLGRLLTDEEEAYLAGTAENPVKLALEHDNYPVSFYNQATKSYQGIAIDVINEITEISGIHFEIVSNAEMNWTQILGMLESGDAAMVTQLLYTDERAGRFLFSKTPYSSTYYALLSRIDYPDISNFQVSRTEVGVYRNTAHEYVFYEWFPEYSTAKPYDSQTEGVQALASGEIDLLMASEFIQLSQTNYYENSGLKINILLSTPMESMFGFNKNEEILCSIISKILYDIDTHAIERSWTSRNFDYQKKAATDRLNSFMVFTVVLLMVLAATIFLFFKNKRLSNNLTDIVAKRTFELERQTATLTTIYESIPDILFTVDTDLVYTSCNSSFERFVGATRHAVIGHKVADFTGSSDWADFFQRSNRQVIENAQSITVEEDVVYPNGEPATFETIKTPLFQNGKLVGMLGIARNITERKFADERAKLMLNTTPLACNLIDEYYNVIDANEEASKLLGFKDKQEYLERFWETFPEHQPDGRRSKERAIELIAQTFREGRTVFEWVHKRPGDGTLIPAELTLVRTQYGDAKIIAGYIRDLREHKKMLAEIDHKDNLLQTVNSAAAILLQSETEDFEDDLWKCMGMMAGAVHMDRVYIWKNFTKDGSLYCRQLYEWSEGAEPQQGKDITIEAQYEEVAPGWEQTLSSGRCVAGIVRELSAGEQATLAPQGILTILVVPVFIRDTFWGFVGFDDCHRERVLSEDEVTALLAGSIMIASALLRNEMILDIQNAVEAAQEASRAKSNFLSNMSHEIRTPLNAITGMTLIGKSTLDVKKKDYSLEKIEEASVHLLGVINDILDMSKIEANKFELSHYPFDFEKMIQKVVSVVNLRIYEKNQHFTVYIDNRIPFAMVGDAQRLAQVITNLLSNSAKFTPEREQVRLEAHWLSEDDDVCTVQINVIDTGIGIAPSRQPFIFDSFEQSDNNTARKYGGTGLGLSISKYIVELMGGEIWLESEIDHGSTFSFTARLQRDSEKKSFMPAVARRGLHVLVIDEDCEAREYFGNLAERLGLICDMAEGEAEAQRRLDGEGRYDLFFVDSRTAGASLLSKRLKVRFPATPVVIMTSSFEWSELEGDATDSGIDHFIPKPLFMSSIAACINECLGQNNDAEQAPESKVTFHGCLLLAEDVEINREIVISLLEDTGLTIDCAENGIKALEMFLAAPERYNLIFMDLQMPEMDGLEATRRIRALDIAQAKEIPIVAMTANVFREDIEKCKQAGMNDHLGKPLDMDEVMEKLGRYLAIDN